MKPITTSLTVDFGSGATQESLSWQIDDELWSPDPAQVYLRLYGDAEKVTASSGRLQGMGPRTEEIVDVLSFTNSSEASLSGRAVASASIGKVGSFYSSTGDDFSPRLTHDSDLGLVRADRTCYGVAKAIYDTKYKLYLFTFAGRDCNSWQEAQIVAINFTNEASASITLQPPDCGEVLWPQPYKVKLKLEVNPRYPPRVNSGGAGCTVWLSPAVSDPVSVVAYPGEIQTAQPSTQRAVIEVATFDGEGSATLSYSPQTEFNLTVLGNVVNKWGSNVLPRWATGGDSVVDVTWESERRATNQVRRIVESDELVATDMFDRVIPIYGAVQLRYRITQRSFTVQFAPEVGVGDFGYKEGYQDAHVVVFDGNRSGQLTIPAPTAKE